MHTGINAQLVTFASNYRQAGMSRFVEQMVRALQRRDSSHRYSVFVNDAARAWFSDSPGMRFVKSSLPASRPALRVLWEQAALPWLSRRLDVLHCPVNVLPLAPTCPAVLTIHDLSFVRFPERFRLERRVYLTAFTRLSARRAARIATDSVSTKRDVMRFFGQPEDKIEVVYPGADERFRPLPAAEVEAFCRRKGLAAGFLLYMGTLEPRKNLDTLVTAYALLRRQAPDSPPLVIAGAKGWMFEQIFKTVEDYGLEDRVMFPGYVDTEEQSYWYGAARAFVYPSLYEGFGLPVLEAMACGTPVITSNTSSLPEVAGQAAITIEPRDAERLAAALRELLASSELRAEMGQAGRRQAASFSWDRAAEQLENLYQQVARPSR